MPTAEIPIHTVERGQPLESSILWHWMKNFYADGGVAVWSEGDVPFHITNTPAMAADWARSIFGFVRDFHSRGLLDPESAICVVELGPGTGRHAFYLLAELVRLEEMSKVLRPDGYRFCLQLAELGQSGLRSLAKHPQFLEALESGRLHLGLFDAESDLLPQKYPKRKKGKALLPSPNPVFVIANYLLDSLPHDLVWTRKGEAVRALATVGVHGLRAEEDPNKAKGLGGRIELTFDYPKEATQYPDPHWNEILGEYCRQCDDSHIPFPTVSLRLLTRMRNWSQTAAILLAADKSFTHAGQLLELDEPELVAHGGGFSFNANVHALGRYAELCGGSANHTSARDGTLDLSHIMIPAEGVELKLPFLEAGLVMKELERFHSVDRFRIREGIGDPIQSPSLRFCLDIIRLAAFDPQTLYELSDDMLSELEGEELEEETETELLWCLSRCLSLTFPVGDDVDVAFEVGRLAYRIEAYELAQAAFELSIQRFGEDPKAYFNLGLGWYYRRCWKDAEQAFRRALELDKDYEDAKTWLAKTERAAIRSTSPVRSCDR